MTTTITTAARAHGTGSAADAVATIASDLRAGLAGQDAAVVLFFASASYDPDDLAGPLAASFPDADVLGCSTAGEFTDAVDGVGGVSAVALPLSLVARHAAVLAELGDDPAGATKSAMAQISDALGCEVRTLDPSNHLGFILIDGMHGAEEAVNEALGNAAPLLDVVGGSAGDDLAFQDTWVSVGDRVSHRGAALVVCELTRPFTVLRSSTFTSTGKRLRVTKADAAARIVHEFDGRPATEAYAEAIDWDPAALDSTAFMQHPVGLITDDDPFIRSPQQVTGDGGIQFYCQVLDGMDVDVMQSGDIVAATSAAFAQALDVLGGQATGGVLFNCILRRLELDAGGNNQAFVDSFAGVPLAGFHTYGESWLGHMNQTITGVIFA